MENLCITLYIDTPIIMGKYPLNLDGLLYWAAYEGHNDSEIAALEVLNQALDSQDGIFKSSDLIFLETKEVGITHKEAVFTTNFKWKEHAYPLNKKSIMEVGGPYRARLSTYNAIGCKAVRFYARGNRDLIHFLIDTAGFIGRGNNQGHGEISEIVIETTDKDLSWHRINADGDLELQRGLPAAIARKIKGMDKVLDDSDKTFIKIKPPYTKTSEVMGFSTNFKRDTLIKI